jgi:PhoU domain
MLEEFELCDREIRTLAERVIDLGVYTEEMFKNAIALLFTRDWSSILTIFQANPDVSPVTLVGEAIDIMKRWELSPERMRTVIALQQASTEFEQILTTITRIAERARFLEMDIERYFVIIGPNGHQSFYRLVNSAYVQLRGCILALSTRQGSMATKIIEQDVVLDQAYLEAQAAIKSALAVDVSLTMSLGSISVVIGDIEKIGNHVTRICQRIEAISQGIVIPFGGDAGLPAVM